MVSCRVRATVRPSPQSFFEGLGRARFPMDPAPGPTEHAQGSRPPHPFPRETDAQAVEPTRARGQRWLWRAEERGKKQPLRTKGCFCGQVQGDSHRVGRKQLWEEGANRSCASHVKKRGKRWAGLVARKCIFDVVSRRAQVCALQRLCIHSFSAYPNGVAKASTARQDTRTYLPAAICTTTTGVKLACGCGLQCRSSSKLRRARRSRLRRLL